MRFVVVLGVVGLGLAVSGCVSTTTRSYGPISSNEAVGRCIRDTSIGGSKAPQVMTYDTATGTETRTTTDGKQYSFSARNRGEATGVGVKGGLKKEGVLKTTFDKDFEVCRESGPANEIDPVATGALVGAAAAGYAAGQNNGN